MKLLEQRIRKDGVILSSSILKVDTFINHAVDPILMDQLAQAFYERFKDQAITKVVTIESSGISIAVLVALKLRVPLIIIKKTVSVTTDENVYSANVYSFTKCIEYKVSIAKKLLNANDNCLFIDDFLANGQACLGAVELVEQAHAKMQNFGILIEKTFQSGRQLLDEQNYNVYSLARITSLDPQAGVQFIEEE
ncbi:xanthine phosphoribosyltransferase [Ureaplasma miroungigenitalium]|uniref:Xanthine phosphoribosyltransferase n=1 Tax=Ureaplasma miroungigenitalium TaxID=1042321 RepID=A0ABT3BM65_9BACT|nr:xanthine phosphoribosyltransferase [Ureaplasma miroungigenitalium]MCV3728338.1 xanthine phosphoribosyltransferase [Ureaplasma miroungigenitalium]